MNGKFVKNYIQSKDKINNTKKDLLNGNIVLKNLKNNDEANIEIDKCLFKIIKTKTNLDLSNLISSNKINKFYQEASMREEKKDDKPNEEFYKKIKTEKIMNKNIIESSNKNNISNENKIKNIVNTCKNNNLMLNNKFHIQNTNKDTSNNFELKKFHSHNTSTHIDSLTNINYKGLKNPFNFSFNDNINKATTKNKLTSNLNDPINNINKLIKNSFLMKRTQKQFLSKIFIIQNAYNIQLNGSNFNYENIQIDDKYEDNQLKNISNNPNVFKSNGTNNEIIDINTISITAKINNKKFDYNTNLKLNLIKENKQQKNHLQKLLNSPTKYQLDTLEKNLSIVTQNNLNNNNKRLFAENSKENKETEITSKNFNDANNIKSKINFLEVRNFNKFQSKANTTQNRYINSNNNNNNCNLTFRNEIKNNFDNKLNTKLNNIYQRKNINCRENILDEHGNKTQILDEKNEALPVDFMENNKRLSNNIECMNNDKNINVELNKYQKDLVDIKNENKDSNNKSTLNQKIDKLILNINFLNSDKKNNIHLNKNIKAQDFEDKSNTFTIEFDNKLRDLEKIKNTLFIDLQKQNAEIEEAKQEKLKFLTLKNDPNKSQKLANFRNAFYKSFLGNTIIQLTSKNAYSSNNNSNNPYDFINEKSYRKLYLVVGYEEENNTALIKSAIERNTTLRWLEFKNNDITDIFGFNIAEIINTNKHIYGINFEFNNFSENASKNILESLKNSEYIEWADFKDNIVTNDFYENLSELFKKNSFINMMNITHSNLTDENLFIIFNGIKTNKTLKRINLSNNLVSDEGILSIKEILRINKKLNFLNFSNNNITDSGIKIFLDILQENIYITELNLSRNYIGNFGFIFIIEILKRNKSLLKLNLEGNLLDDYCISMLLSYLEGNEQNSENIKNKLDLIEEKDENLSSISDKNIEITQHENKNCEIRLTELKLTFLCFHHIYHENHQLKIHAH